MWEALRGDCPIIMAANNAPFVQVVEDADKFNLTFNQETVTINLIRKGGMQEPIDGDLRCKTDAQIRR